MKAAIVVFTAVAIGMTIGVLLWVLIPAIPSPDSHTNITATVICYENRSVLLLYVKTFDRLHIDSLIVGYKVYNINASAIWEKRIVVDGDACPCTNCNSEFIDGELITSRGVYRVNVFIVQAYAKPLFA